MKWRLSILNLKFKRLMKRAGSAAMCSLHKEAALVAGLMRTLKCDVIRGVLPSFWTGSRIQSCLIHMKGVAQRQDIHEERFLHHSLKGHIRDEFDNTWQVA